MKKKKLAHLEKVERSLPSNFLKNIYKIEEEPSKQEVIDKLQVWS